jgi:hypothetical protein
MRKGVIAAVATLAIVGSLGVGSAATAKEGDVIKTGPCSSGSDWKLKLSPEDGRIEVEFEVDQNVVGDTWRVRIRQNGERIFRATKVTRAPSGSFEVRTVAPNTAGTDIFKAFARNVETDETCLARATF